MLEKKVENYLKEEVERIGGICFKFTSPGNVGVPDRLVLLKGRSIFVELKRPNQKPTDIQKYQHKRIREQGMYVWVIDSLNQVDDFTLKLKYFMSTEDCSVLENEV